MQTQAGGPWLRVAARSVVGPVKVHNQQAAAVFELGGGDPLVCGSASPRNAALTGAFPADAGVGLLVVHGIGGQSTGDWACEAVVDALAAQLREEIPEDAEARSAWLAGALHETSARVDAYAKKRSGPHGSLGATVVFAVAFGNAVHVVHVGDVRAYLFRDGRLLQLTVDDSLINHYRAETGLEPTEEERRQIRNIITQGLGFDGKMKPHVGSIEAGAGDVLMICTPGLHEFVDVAKIEEELGRAADLGEACAKLEALAVSRGSDANVSVLLARFEGRQSAGA
ncbi:PP2C family protein-serine/threonine phosphatase [Polyangium aurulentum]|uniref:PP2C family protein-serine/threonine phosphatase n=1 Tax=Polyangium aurulentum TaxID=2567896 RepID=UPI0010ADC05F|nr:PP2C family serine/threonine-protein phosphatase [Polyangium aurulentum]UQA56568.1 serine/threonine-protein phosphatase [Polyangium aurulentum]